MSGFPVQSHVTRRLGRDNLRSVIANYDELREYSCGSRFAELREAHGIGYCNITKCCTKVCPEEIQITDNGIIPLKERVVDEFYDPLGWLWRRSKKVKKKRDS